ncbi:MAG: hypothetical protein ABR499_14765 [Gemmatimonadaceae bacterium]
MTGGATRGGVHRADRIRDWIAMGLVIAGALLYGSAQRGMGSLARDPTPTTAEQSARGEWKMVRWNRLQRMSRAGITLVAAGAAVAVWSFARHAARRWGTGNAA